MQRKEAATDTTFPLLAASGHTVVGGAGADVGRNREEMRRNRLKRLALFAGIPALALWLRIATGNPINLLQMPHIDWLMIMPILFFGVLIIAVVGPFWFFGRSPHVVYRPEQIDVRLSDVVGIETVKEEVIRSLNLFLAHKTFAGTMGGTPRRGLLFEGAPGTGKTYTAKAMAAEAGVPFLFVSGTSFQSMFYGATAMKIRGFFKAARKAALAHGGAIAFMEEIDAIGATRRGLGMTAAPDLSQSVASSVQCCGSVTSMPATLPMTHSPAAPVT